MRFQVTFFMLFISFYAFGVDDQSMNELFQKYDSIMDHKKIELIDEVFTKKFIKGSGGKKELINKIKSLPESLVQSQTTMSWKKGNKGEIYLATLKEKSLNKKISSSSEAEFIVIKENGKLKIDGTISDAQ
jgi:hypothetical protein